MIRHACTDAHSPFVHPTTGVSQLVPSLPVNGTVCPFESAFANRSNVLNNKYTGISLLYILVFTACIECACNGSYIQKIEHFSISCLDVCAWSSDGFTVIEFCKET